MRFMNTTSRNATLALGMLLELVAMPAIDPWIVVAAETPSTENLRTNEEPQTAKNAEFPQAAIEDIPVEKIVRGNFVSFEGRVLTLKYYKARGEYELIRSDIPENAKTLLWNHDEGCYKPVDTAEAMTRLKALLTPVSGPLIETPDAMSWRKAAGMGLSVQTVAEHVTIRIGENKTPFKGNFVSFKDGF